jgi:hypothetical protein
MDNRSNDEEIPRKKETNKKQTNKGRKKRTKQTRENVMKCLMFMSVYAINSNKPDSAFLSLFTSLSKEKSTSCAYFRTLL